jgi:hypothetical protein
MKTTKSMVITQAKMFYEKYWQTLELPITFLKMKHL